MGEKRRTNDIEDTLADHRLAPRQSNLANAHVDERPGNIDDLAVGHEPLLRRELDAGLWHAVCTPKVAALSQRDAQVRVLSGKAVDEGRSDRIEPRQLGLGGRGTGIQLVRTSGGDRRGSSNRAEARALGPLTGAPERKGSLRAEVRA